MASLAEQLRLLSNPEPSRFDLDEDEFDATRAQVIDKGDEDEDVENHPVQKSSVLRKQAVPLLQEEDTKYAGRKISRAQLDALRDDPDSLGGKEDNEDESDSEGDDDETSDDEDLSSKNSSNDSDDDDTRDETISRELTFHSSDDNNHIERDKKSNNTSVVKLSSTESNGNNLPMSGSESDEEEASSSSEDDNTKGNGVNDDDDEIYDDNEDDDEIDDDDDDEENDDENEEDEMEGDDGVQSFSVESLKEDVEKGNAAKNQIDLWDNILEIRIRLQKALLVANKLPQQDNVTSFKSSGDKNLKEMYKQGRKAVANLLGNLLLIQEKLLEQNPDTKNILHPETSSNGNDSHDSDNDDDDNEEIPSESDEEESAKNEEMETEKLANGGEGEGSLKLPAKRKHKLATSEYSEYISKRHTAFQGYRDSTISKWSEKTRLASGKLNSKSFSSFDRSALAQISHILADKDRLVKRTQLKRSSYRVLGKSESEGKQEAELKEEQSDVHLKDYDSEIFDDDDFYHQLLREFIEQRTSGGGDNPIEMGRQWLELQKLRRKVKKTVDRKASKGRKIRYDVHAKLVSFMAPIEKGPMADTSRNELFCSLFGTKQSKEAWTSASSDDKGFRHLLFS